MSAPLQILENIRIIDYKYMLTHSYLCDSFTKTAVTLHTWNNLRTTEWIFIKFNLASFN